ncbi:hypothetical protein FKX98_10665, partial [Bifidobacterium breve]|nr:hypothetical protein [Bifidobacterium breve]
MKWTNSYRSFGLKTKRSTGLKTIEHKHRWRGLSAKPTGGGQQAGAPDASEPAQLTALLQS